MLEAAWSRIEADLAALPPPLNACAAELLRSMAARNGAAYFHHPDAYPTPQVITWIGKGYLPEEPEFLERLLAASLWLFLFVRLQDDHLDEPAARPEGLLLGNVCAQRGLAELHRLLPADERFQAEAVAAWTAFSAVTAWEKAVHWGRPAPFSEHDLDRLGEKFAAIRLPVAAILCRAGRADLIPAYGRALQELGVAVQMQNDLHNWEADLAAGNFTYFLTRAGGDPAGALSGGTAAEECLGVARRSLHRALEALPPGAPEALRDELRRRAGRVEARQAGLIRAKLGLA